MAEGMNRVILIGNLGTEPELSYTPSNQPVLKFRLATNESYVTKAGERQQRTEWHSVVVWGKRGEALHKILGKGNHICVEGSIRSREWEGRDGNKRRDIDIVAQNIVLLGGRRGDAPGVTRADAAGGASATGGPGGAGGGDESAPPPSNDFGSGSSGGEDDIPF